MKADWPQSTHILILRFGICKTITLINFIKLILQKKKKVAKYAPYDWLLYLVSLVLPLLMVDFTFNLTVLY